MTADLRRNQARLRELVIGAGTPYEFTGPVQGLGTLEPTVSDRDQYPSDGASSGDEALPTRRVMIPLAVEGLDREPAAVMRTFRTLKSAFRHVDGVELLELELRLPGLTDDPNETLSFFGRPRGAREDLADLKSGEISALCRFDALDPLGYGTAVEASSVAGTDATPISISVGGDMPTRRLVMTITGDGGIPLLRNQDDDDRYLAWLAPLEADAVRIIDFHARTVVDDDGVDRYPEISSASPWFAFWPGANRLEAWNMTFDYTIRPAHN